MQVLHILLLVFIIGCAVSVSLTKNLLTALVIFMGQSLAMRDRKSTRLNSSH